MTSLRSAIARVRSVAARVPGARRLVSAVRAARTADGPPPTGAPSLLTTPAPGAVGPHALDAELLSILICGSGADGPALAALLPAVEEQARRALPSPLTRVEILVALYGAEVHGPEGHGPEGHGDEGHGPGADAEDAADADARVVAVGRIEGRHAAWGSAANAALARARGRRVVFVPADALPAPGWLHGLLAAADAASVVQSVALAPDGTVHSAGLVAAAPRALPVHLLSGHPAEDLPERPVPVAAPGAAVLTVDRTLLRGMDPSTDAAGALLELALPDPGAEAEPLSFALAGSSRVTLSTPPPRDLGWATPLLLQRGFLPVTAAAAYGAAGYAVDRLLPGPPTSYGLQRAAVPSLSRPRPAVSDRPERLRWALKTSAVAGPAGEQWGDRFFACDLRDALQRLGQEVVIDNRETRTRPESDYLDDVTLVLRGRESVPTNPAGLNLLWVISHPDAVSDAELLAFDAVYAASEPWAAARTAAGGVPVAPLLQATAPARFHPRVAATPISGALFVGRTREVFRPIVRDALAVDADLTVYGEGWAGLIDPSVIAADFLPNAIVPGAYRGARVVLNDHWSDMAAAGFISNRLFDAVATGTRVITDPIEGLDAVFGSAVRAYRDQDDLRSLLFDDSRWPAAEELERTAARVADEHSFDRRAERLLDDALRLRSAASTG